MASWGTWESGRWGADVWVSVEDCMDAVCGVGVWDLSRAETGRAVAGCTGTAHWDGMDMDAGRECV